MEAYILTMFILHVLSAAITFIGLVAGLFPYKVERSTAFGVATGVLASGFALWAGHLLWG